MESCNRIKDGNGRLIEGEYEVQMIWKEYFEDLYYIDIREHKLNLRTIGVLACKVWLEKHMRES